jgi:endonuclease YncB( thermonuclease family)
MFSRISNAFRNISSCCRSKEYNDIQNIETMLINKNNLNDITYKDTIAFIPPITYGKVIKVYDGDTITIASRLPFEGSPIYRFSVRLAGIDSPEIRGGSIKETEMAIVARDALRKLIFGKIVELRNNGKEKYGRLLANLYYNDGTQTIHINKWMLDNNYAIEYYGKKKIAFVDSE